MCLRNDPTSGITVVIPILDSYHCLDSRAGFVNYSPWPDGQKRTARLIR